jgi:type II secretory pathway pseudopilin PulG
MFITAEKDDGPEMANRSKGRDAKPQGLRPALGAWQPVAEVLADFASPLRPSSEAIVVDREPDARESGFTVLEAAVSLTLLAVALLSLWGTLVYCSRSNVAAEQRMKALNAAQAKIEELKSVPFESLINEFGPAGATGDTFDVPSIDEDRTKASGQIAFFVDETDSHGEVLGFPLDLNGDGDSEDLDVSEAFSILPVRVSVRWDGVLGEQRVDLRAILRKED